MKKSKGGFTLVEVIVVLVVLSILAAILVPSMTGWIDEARKRQYIADARLVYLAAQSAVSEQYGLNHDDFVERANEFPTGFDDSGSCGRVSTNMLQRVQKGNEVFRPDQEVDVAIATLVLQYLDSEDKSTARYKFENSKRPTSGQEVSKYHEGYKQPGIIILYNAKGEVIMVEFGYEDYLVHIDADGLVCTKGGSYSNDAAMNDK
ncbi:MAG: prepilin-type N-terminal cleavage/methylation domain-containing protein [Oscillospiraceae bacterium]|nr:prepilin-type N-terminal cleavage/methylation domain-containing protein [Oscillospiraceae bacterium]